MDDEMYGSSTLFNLIANTEYLWTCDIQVRSRHKNDMNIAPTRRTRKYSFCKKMAHTKTQYYTLF